MNSHVSSGTGQHRRRLTLLAAVIATVVTAILALSGSAEAAPPVGLSVDLNDGVTQVRPNLPITYTATLGNQSGKSVHATLVLTVPAYVSVRKTGGGTQTKNAVTWSVTVPAGKTLRRSATAVVGKIPSTASRVTSLVSVYQGRARGVPVIRSAVANTIAGVTDPAGAAPNTEPTAGTITSHSSDGSSDTLAWTLGAAGAVVVLTGIGWLLRRRRRRAQQVRSRMTRRG